MSTRDPKYMTFFEAAKSGDKNRMEQLLSEGVNVNLKDKVR